MITIKGVTATPKELRPISRGWGRLHWWICVPMFVPCLGLLAMVLTLADMASWYEELCEAVGIIMVATGVLWLVAHLVVKRVTAKTTRATPLGGLPCDWHIDAEGLDFHTPISTTHVDWAAIKAVEEERDRFIFLLMPQNSPVLPKRLLAEGQAEALLALIAEAKASGRLGRGVD